MACGIYGIHNTANGKWYIGQTVNSLAARKSQHFSALRHGRHGNNYLQRSFALHGEAWFEFHVLEQCPEDMLDIRETAWIKYYRSTISEHGYNLESGGNEKKHLSIETRHRISAALVGNKYRKGIPHSDETRRRMAAGQRGTKNQFYGRHHSAETKQKLSEQQRGNTICLGRKLSDETRRKIAKSLTGKKLSAETRQKMSMAHLARAMQHNKEDAT
jgi:group I intron endonuclease